jgi:hypothetical protein
MAGPTSRQGLGAAVPRAGHHSGREPEFLLAGACTGLCQGTGDYIETALPVPSLVHIHEALTEATEIGKALHPEFAAHGVG